MCDLSHQGLPPSKPEIADAEFFRWMKVTGAYCEARQRLPERLLARLVQSSGDQLHARVPASSLRRQFAGLVA